MKIRIFLISIIIIISFIYAMPPMDNDFSSYSKSNIFLHRDIPNELNSAKVSGTWNAIVILIDFPDYRWDNQTDTLFDNDSLFFTKTYFENMLCSEGTFKDPQSISSYTGSMRDYYNEASYNQFEVVCSVAGWYTASNNFAYYSDGYGSRAEELVSEAINLADADVNFRHFDNDSDGIAEAVFVVHAGPAAEELPEPERWNYIWSHASSAIYEICDSVVIDYYSTEPQTGKIGVFCHEFGHQLGLPDLYDTDYSSEGAGEWCLMGGGSWCHRDDLDPHGTCPVHFCSPFKFYLGWLTPIEPVVNTSNITLRPLSGAPDALLLYESSMPGNEYFMAENRQNIGFDAGLTRRQVENAFDLAHGLIIYHIDDAMFSNSDEFHRLVDVEESSPVFNGSYWVQQLDYPREYPGYLYLYNGNRGDNGDPWPGYSDVNADTTQFANRNKTAFNAWSNPSAVTYTGYSPLIGYENIIETDTLINVDAFVAIENSLLEPHAGTVLYADSQFTIEWESECAGGIYRDSLYLSADNQSTWSLICVISDSSQNYAWTVPDTMSTDCYLRLASIDRSSRKTSCLSGKFTIDNSAGITRSRNELSDNSDLNIYSAVTILKINALLENGEIAVFDIMGRKQKYIAQSGKYLIIESDGGKKSIILMK